ncbi:hypothetical protein EHS25_008005 [Saitozyma podzolica]|uniref:Uncharacterized protein n=1 Tax=Saitozyma podzolica TaxID=1890683 RepID=A0A427YND4_9TREE|nr:hypothetical protein EHS25_008005 [Saitozyma podzolica]
MNSFAHGTRSIIRTVLIHERGVCYRANAIEVETGANVPPNRSKARSSLQFVDSALALHASVLRRQLRAVLIAEAISGTAPDTATLKRPICDTTSIDSPSPTCLTVAVSGLESDLPCT